MSGASFPSKLEFYIKTYGFEDPPREPTSPVRYEELPHEDLVDVCKELRQKVEMLSMELELELKSKLKQARMLSVLEMHLDCLPSLSEGHHAALSLEHATCWVERYGHQGAEGLLADVNAIQRGIMTRRIREVMRQSQLCDTRPACKHVLTARPNTVHKGELLTFNQIVLGLPLQQFLETITGENITEDKQIWKRLDGTIEHFARTDDRITADELRTKSFLSLYFYAQTSESFLKTRLTHLTNIQRDGHNKKNIKACDKVPQSNFRRKLNQFRKAFGDEDLETVSPTKSTMSGLAVRPHSGTGISRSKHQSMVKLYEQPDSPAVPLMAGAIRGSGTLASAAAEVNRARRQGSTSRGAHGGAPRLEQIRENESLPSSPAEQAQAHPLKRRERVHRDKYRSSRDTAGAEDAPSHYVRRTPSHRNPVSPVSESPDRQQVSPIVPAERASPVVRTSNRRESPLVPFSERVRGSARGTSTPDTLGRKSSSASRPSVTSPTTTHRLHPSARATPRSSGQRRPGKSPVTPGTTPGPGALPSTKDAEGKGKAVDNDQPPDTPASNPFTSKEPAGLPEDWNRQPSEMPSKRHSEITQWPGPGADSFPATPTPAPRPASSIYSAYLGGYSKAMPHPLRINRDRDREARERIYKEEEPPKTPGKRQGKPTTPEQPKSSPAASIPAGVDLTNVAGGLGHGYDYVRQRDSSSTLNAGNPAVPAGVDLDTAAGTTQRFVPARKHWDPSKKPAPTDIAAIRKQYQPRTQTYLEHEQERARQSAGQRTLYPASPSTTGKKSTPSLRRKQSPLIPLRGASLASGSSVNPSAGQGTGGVPGPDNDEWSSRIGLPPSPGGTSVLPASKAQLASGSPARGRPARPRAIEEEANYLVPSPAPDAPTAAVGRDDSGGGSTSKPAAAAAAAKRPSSSPGRRSKFREHIDSLIGSEYNPVTNPEPASSREPSRDKNNNSSTGRIRTLPTRPHRAVQPPVREKRPISPLFGGGGREETPGERERRLRHERRREERRQRERDREERERLLREHTAHLRRESGRSGRSHRVKDGK